LNLTTYLDLFGPGRTGDHSSRGSHY